MITSLMITSLTRLGSNLLAAQKSAKDVLNSSVITICEGDGKLVGLRWPYYLNEQGMYSKAKKLKGSWTGNYWSFPSTDAAKDMLASLQKEFPDLPLVEAAGKTNSEAENTFCTMPISGGISACLLSRELSYSTGIPGLLNQGKLFAVSTWPSQQVTSEENSTAVNVFEVKAGTTRWVAILASPETVARIVEAITTYGATEKPALAERFQTSSPVKVSTLKWAVTVSIDLCNPRHWLLIDRRRDNEVENGWAKVSTTRGKWEGKWKHKIEAAGLQWVGDDPSEDISTPVSFNQDNVAGWNAPAPLRNGSLAG